MDDSQIQQVRRFNRAVTRRIGVLTDDYLGRGRPLAESRLLFEIGSGGVNVRELRARLSLDSGYLSRLLRALEGQELVSVQPSPDDARVRRVTLTRKGRRELHALDSRSQTLATSLLAPLGAAQRERLIAAMTEVERLLRAAAVEIAVADPASADAHACIDAYLRELDMLFDGGFDASRSVSAEPGELVLPRGVFVIARLDGEAIGCGGLKITGAGAGEIKRMWVAPSVRGLGIAQRLLDALQAHAVVMGLDTLRLDTNCRLTEARALYARNGYREIPRYNDNPYADHWFEKRLDPGA
ncbi:bifunctional helix-turn-helix transcriptional regulator/GNAT family N-acetyltransferase [Pseudoxanthomonas wuyuanensis]